MNSAIATQSAGAQSGGPPVRGIMDADSHEMIPMHMWGEAFGQEAAALFAPMAQGILSKGGANNTVRPDILADSTGITEESVWNQKGPDAPSAIDMGRRLAVMDAMGIERQLIFPTFALIGINMFYNPDAAAHFRFDPAAIDRKVAGRLAVDGYNRWAARIARQTDGSRLRPVGIVLTDSIDGMMSSAERLLEEGVRALWIPNGVPPADTSPGDPALDPFWSLAARENVPVLLHVGTQFAFCSPKWYANVEAFTYGTKTSIEFPIEPYRASTINLAVEAFLGAMILGGVFERHPQLRFGVVECGAQWAGPLADKLDLWADQYKSRLSGNLSMPPSQYLARNVRATPFFFEPIARYMERYPELADVYCYGSDFPHVEGGKASRQRFQDDLARLDPAMSRKFFIDNGALLLPG